LEIKFLIKVSIKNFEKKKCSEILFENKKLEANIMNKRLK